MLLQLKFHGLSLGKCLSFVACMALSVCVGCSEKDVTETAKKAEASAEQAAAAIAEDAEQVADQAAEKGKEAVEKGKEVAGELGEKAMSFLTPLKEKFGNLETLKDKPEELKAAVAELIQTIEEKAEGITLPESMSGVLATVKEKLVALKDLLEGEFDQAKVEERIQEIKESVTKGLGMDGK